MVRLLNPCPLLPDACGRDPVATAVDDCPVNTLPVPLAGVLNRLEYPLSAWLEFPVVTAGHGCRGNKLAT